jgi:hypothetical protein
MRLPIGIPSLIAIMLAGTVEGVSAAPDKTKSCQFRTAVCMTRCVQNNPESVCRRYCTQGLVCAFSESDR